MSESAPEPKPLPLEELNRLRLVFSALREFHDGYVHTERVARLDSPSPALLRFFYEALTAKLDGFYQDRNGGLLSVLRLVNCPFVAEIEAALDTPIGTSTFGRLHNEYRDKNIAHPQFRMNHQQTYLEHFKSHLASPQDIEALKRADAALRRSTAIAYVWLEKVYPQLGAEADAHDKAVDDDG